MIKIKRDLEKIIKRHKAFVSLKDMEGPLLCINILGNDLAASYEKTFAGIPRDREVRPQDIDLDIFLEEARHYILLHEEIGLDSIYSVEPYFWIPWMEAIMGCPIYAGKNSFYSEPFIGDWKSFDWEIDLSGENAWLQKLLSMSEALVEAFGDKYPISSSTHLRGPADMMSAALGQKRFPLEIYDNPEEIKKLCDICTDAFIDVAGRSNRIASGAKFKGSTVNYFGIWTEDVCQYYQDDAVVFLSPEFYREFILESHLKIDRNFPSTFYHNHPVSLYVVEELIRFPNLRMIEIDRELEAIGPSLEEMIPACRKIQDHGKALIINFGETDFDEDFIEYETKAAFENLSSKGLCIYICAGDIEDGLRKAGAVNNIFKIF